MLGFEGNSPVRVRTARAERAPSDLGYARHPAAAEPNRRLRPRSVMLVTALCPAVGYDKAPAIVRKANVDGTTLAPPAVPAAHPAAVSAPVVRSVRRADADALVDDDAPRRPQNRSYSLLVLVVMAARLHPCNSRRRTP